MTVVLDASAVLAVIFSEPGAGRVLAVARGGLISAVNFSEALAKSADKDFEESEVERQLLRLGMVVVPFDVEQARRAASLRRATRTRSVSFADRACLSLAQERGLPVLTGDRLWAGLDIGVEIRLIR